MYNIQYIDLNTLLTQVRKPITYWRKFNKVEYISNILTHNSNYLFPIYY